MVLSRLSDSTDDQDSRRSSLDSRSTDFFHEDTPIFVYPPRTSRLRTVLSLPGGMYRYSASRCGRRKGPAFICLCGFATLFFLFAFHQRFVSAEKRWPRLLPFSSTSTRAYDMAELRQIWEWEIRAGHYPSRREIPRQIGLKSLLRNPALPPNKTAVNSPSSDVVTNTIGTGLERIYPDVGNRFPDNALPPRPIPGSIIDLDILLENCDFDTNKYVRDCLELLRLGGGLDGGTRLRREETDGWRYIYVESGAGERVSDRETTTIESGENITHESELSRKTFPPHKIRQQSHCDEKEARIFHMFWAGPFTDKPYMAMLSFLFTQNLGLHLEGEDHGEVCRPKLWLWVSRESRHASTTANGASAIEEMLDDLHANPWAAPFLHPRFNHVIQFKLWNTAEQLDSIPELKNEWRELGDKLNSDGSVAKSEGKKIGSTVDPTGKNTETALTYNKLPVILSDMARFVLCHRFGGVYLDVDMLFLRDWEELWGWRGAYAYRWSWEDRYNTAVLKLNKGSALGTFFFQTALQNGLDFHPTTITRYLKESYMERLLYRIPDALFDPAWLSTDHRKPLPWTRKYFQRDRPPQPFFTDFDQFFNTPADVSGAPHALGIEGFFRGAYLYHYHNEWWKPFDSRRFWPDLGPRFGEIERIAQAAVANKTFPPEPLQHWVKHDKRDLDWSTVLKRTFEAYIRGERPNMYGEWLRW
ncbi:hypothetical protein A0H81_00849 [Grifola frondosa]|uniref:Uncharacterized protein n=1 Tax=Grifola frondosa TaxID=5627 RepID=A0A1C7MT49_GRIFR|nr:hypothetical protein A0H81_00849 [Grifola frondosa]